MFAICAGERDDMVKLYDLTDHCKNEMLEGDNPFTVPVGLLCYRVGRNLKVSGQRRSADARAMLENCLRLLDENKHEEVVVVIDVVYVVIVVHVVAVIVLLFCSHIT